MSSSVSMLPRLAVCLLLFLVGCHGGATGCSGPATAIPLAGGEAGTIASSGVDAFALPMPALSTDQERAFFKGRALFRDIWVAAPASTASRDGLGPFFNARSCEGCHIRDGRGRPPLSPEETATSMLVRLSVRAGDGGVEPEPVYGGQLQPLALEGVPPEGDLHVDYEEVPGAYGDGTPFSLRRPRYRIERLGYGPFAPGTMMSPRVAPGMVGLGLLDAVSEETILEHADPDDADDDGISGRPNRPLDLRTGAKRLGRFGWKANQPSVEQQVASAFLGDLGITSAMLPAEDCTSAQKECAAAPSGGSPELDPTIFDNVVFYAKTLAVPERRHTQDDGVRRGERLFDDSGCAACHTPTLVTGSYPDIPALSHQTIHPYTDLLLHDMGEGLADGRPDHDADGQEWRTPPLWGLGLQKTVNEHSFFLHDGRARNAAEAILWHGGEAQKARERFRLMNAVDRQALLAFLDSL